MHTALISDTGHRANRALRAWTSGDFAALGEIASQPPCGGPSTFEQERAEVLGTVAGSLAEAAAGGGRRNPQVGAELQACLMLLRHLSCRKS